ncbi:MAG: hypothetical protein IJX85_11600 [Lachnospiraceae bacterium]|nr:hypothetical protein [Lachnospiraceae bacterium]
MYRKPKPEGYVEPMPKKQFFKLLKEFKAIGGTFGMGEDVDRFLEMQNAEASTLNGFLILFSSKPSRSAVYEELIHAEQYRNNKNDGSYRSRLENEIEAQEILIEKADEYELTEPEIVQTKKALASYKKELQEYLSERGN